MVKAVLDIHEPEELHDELLAHGDVDDVKLAPLAAADIVVEGVGFERKTMPDYASSLVEGRLDDQTDKLGEAYPHAYVLVDDDMADTERLKHSNLKPSSLRGHMASLTARDDSGVHAVVPCSETALLADYAVRLARKHTEDPVSSRPVLRGEDIGTDEPAGKRQWACLPNIGPELADRLWQQFGSPVWFVRTRVDTVNELRAVDGIGEERAGDIADALLEGPP